MSLVVLLGTALTLGLLGGLHCVAMCSALQRLAVHGIGADPAAGAGVPARAPIPIRIAAPSAGAGLTPTGSGRFGPLRADLRFHAARIAGYAVLGALVGSGSWLLRWGSEVMPLMRPLWGTMNALLLALGLALLVLGRQPRWIDELGRRVWQATGARLEPSGGRRPVLAGLAWALVPCGLLYSALATAALASEPLRGAAAMAAFGLGTAVNLLVAQGLIHLVSRGSAAKAARVEALGIRIGGGLLAAMSAAALVALALGQPHPFCAT
jgi:sulfite exporter TauE/SafE